MRRRLLVGICAIALALAAGGVLYFLFFQRVEPPAHAPGPRADSTAVVPAAAERDGASATTTLPAPETAEPEKPPSDRTYWAPTAPHPFDPRRFDPLAFLPRALLAARKAMPDAVLESFSAFNVAHDGTCDLAGWWTDLSGTTRMRGPATYTFRPAAKASAGAKCHHHVNVDLFGAYEDDADGEACGKAATGLPPPRCTPAEVMTRTARKHLPRPGRARTVYYHADSDAGPARWEVYFFPTVGRDGLPTFAGASGGIGVTIADDCPVPE